MLLPAVLAQNAFQHPRDATFPKSAASDPDDHAARIARQSGLTDLRHVLLPKGNAEVRL